MIKTTVKVRGEAIRTVRNRIKRITKNGNVSIRIAVGIQEEQGAQPAKKYDGSDSATDLITVALSNEYGTDRIPERPALRSWYDQNIKRMTREAKAAVYNERINERDKLLEQLGAQWADELREWIASGNAGLAELAPSTQDAREAAGISPTPPLYATHQLADAIRVVVSRNSGK